MATLQAKNCRGHKYWYIVESRRVNGKPRPVVLAYLGKPEDLLRRLAGLDGEVRLKSYSHGAVAALLGVAHALDVPNVINNHVPCTAGGEKPLRHDLTVGATLLLGAIGRVCMPTSKRGWLDWAKSTSCEYLLRAALSKVDSQHFWDLMDALPVEAIEKIEQDLLARVRKHYGLAADTLLYDTTNFFTFIATTNARCTIARRAKNKQKRNDLRQVGLALVVTREDQIPLFHETYQGNYSDSNVFKGLVDRVKHRLVALGLDPQKHTLVFDRGNNSKANLAMVARAGLHYVGALTPSQHAEVLQMAQNHYEPVKVGDATLEVFRTRRTVWGEERTLVVFVSERLKAGQWRGIQTALEKAQGELAHLQKTINTPSQHKQTRPQIEARITHIVNRQFVRDIIEWSLTEATPGPWQLTYDVNANAHAELEKILGFRILMTDRHDWPTADIIQAFYQQAHVEGAFKNVKNPYHLAVRPQFHWTDQKIAVHFFVCVLGYLMSALLLRQAKQKTGFTGSMDSFLDTLTSIRLAASISATGKPGKPKIAYQLEELDQPQRQLAQALEILETHLKPPHIDGISVYKSDHN
jgi:transposase